VQTSSDELCDGRLGLVDLRQSSNSFWRSLLTDFVYGVVTLIWYLALLAEKLTYRGVIQLEQLDNPARNDGGVRNDVLSFHVDRTKSLTSARPGASNNCRPGANDVSPLALKNLDRITHSRSRFMLVAPLGTLGTSRLNGSFELPSKPWGHGRDSRCGPAHNLDRLP